MIYSAWCKQHSLLCVQAQHKIYEPNQNSISLIDVILPFYPLEFWLRQLYTSEFATEATRDPSRESRTKIKRIEFQTSAMPKYRGKHKKGRRSQSDEPDPEETSSLTTSMTWAGRNVKVNTLTGKGMFYPRVPMHRSTGGQRGFGQIFQQRNKG